MRRSLVVMGLVVAAALGITTAAKAQDAITASCTSAGVTSSCTSWFWNPVTVVWSATANPAPQSVTGCQLGIGYTFATDQVTDLSCQATWPDGTQDSHSFPLKVEVSSPTPTAVPSRPPDANGWYNHPVTVSFGVSSFSGLASCSPAAATYSGPDTAGATLSGSCTDNAGKTVTASLPIQYDATPPSLSATVSPGDRSVQVNWRASSGLAPLTSLQVVRSPGLHGASPSVLSPTGGSGSYRDSRVRNRVRYRYTVTAVNQAGNVSVRSLVVTPGPRLLTPAFGAKLRRPPLLTWTAIPRATYYNVQLFRGGKVLSAWPKRARLQLQRSWRFAGHRYRLRRGRYRWYVWPGFGRRRAARYGSAVGSGTFTIR